MKIRCPRCQKSITVPDAWAGKAIRCAACNNAFMVPKPKEATAPLHGDAAPDLESLAKLEVRQGAVEEEALANMQAATATSAGEPGITLRTCPHCNKQVSTKDPYVDLLCSHCWKPIPALKKGEGFSTGGVTLIGGSVREAKVGFYEGLGTTFAYPLGAAGSLVAAILVAIGAILLPVGLMTALARTVAQSEVGSAQGVHYEELTGIGKAMIACFWVEVLFFAGVGVHAFIDVTRTTSIGEEQPPSLVWNPMMWGESIIGYIALLIPYAVAMLAAFWLTSQGSLSFPTSVEDFKRIMTPGLITLIIVITFFVPMNLIGLACGKIIEALNPVRIAKSIMATHVNYVFLFMMFCVYMVIYFAIFSVVVTWFGKQVIMMERAAIAGNLINVALGLVSWGAVMGLGFYFTYALGRLCGLFARTFRKDLLFNEV